MAPIKRQQEDYMGKIRRQPHKSHHFSSLTGLQSVNVVNDDNDSRLCLFQCFPETVTFLMQARLFRPLVSDFA